MQKPSKVELLHIDCVEYMKSQPDNSFDLAIVDPPYGIGQAKQAARKANQQYGAMKAANKDYGSKKWDSNVPDAEYFEQLFRVSKNQVIWGANYMTEHLPASMGWIVWNKETGEVSFSDAELAYTSFKRALRMFTFRWSGMLQGDMKNKEERIHPTQKPVKFYEWILENYAKKGDRILDTHVGSGSSMIASHRFGSDFVGCEIDGDYITSAKARFDDHTRQTGFDL